MKNKFSKMFLALAIVISLLFGCLEIYKIALSSFSLSHINPQNLFLLKNPLSYPSIDSSQNIESILKQKFSYLGKGHQTFAFLSEDGQYVLKFFNFYRLTASEPIEWLPSLPFLNQYQNHVQKRRTKKFNRLFNGYNIAFNEDADNTGMIYIHLQKTFDLKTKIQIIDSYQHPHFLNLDDYVFVIQKKVDITKHVLENLLKQGDIKNFEKRIAQLIQLYVSEYKRGLYDSDHNIMSNTGFLGHHAYRIDVGRLTHNTEIQEPLNYHADLKKIVEKRILLWVKRKYPNYYEEISKNIKAQLMNNVSE